MKQDSRTVESQATESTELLTIGIDLGDRKSHYCVLDDSGEVLSEGRFQTTEAGFERQFEHLDPNRIVIETGTHSGWVSRLLESWGHEVYVANARKVRLIHGGDTKSDRLDAEKLARLGRYDVRLLSPIRHRDGEQQADLSVLRARESLVWTRTKLINSVRGLVKSAGHRVPSCSSERFTQEAKTAVPAQLRGAVAYVLEMIDGLNEKIRYYDELIEHMARERYPESALLKQVPGVGTLSAMAFMLTISDPHRFAKSRDVGCYVGLRPRQSDSGEQTPQLRITKAGDPYLRKTLVNCAHWILGPFGADTDLRRWGMKLCERGGKNAKKRAVVAVARKLAVLLHSLWVTGEVYEPLRNSGAEDRAA